MYYYVCVTLQVSHITSVERKKTVLASHAASDKHGLTDNLQAEHSELYFNGEFVADKSESGVVNDSNNVGFESLLTVLSAY